MASRSARERRGIYAEFGGTRLNSHSTHSRWTHNHHNTYHPAVTRPKTGDPRVGFGRAVRRLRQAKGMSQEKLAEVADINRTYIGDVERGTRNIALLNMSKLAAALGISLSRLIQEMEKGDL